MILVAAGNNNYEKIDFSCFYSFFLNNLSALEPRVTKKQLGFEYRGEYNRVFNYCQDFVVFGDIELNKRYRFKAGAALGTLGGEPDIKVFGSGHFIPFIGKAWNFNLAYIYNSIPGYQVTSQTVLPYLSYNGPWVGIAVGPTFRFTSFFGEKALYEPLLSFSLYANFINNKKFIAGVKCANFSDFYARNTDFFSLSANGTFHLNTQWSLVSELEFIQSGNLSLSAAFYGFACRGGIRVSW